MACGDQPEEAPWDAAAFEARYQQSPDPWDFATSPYERRRYERIVGALPLPRYGSGYEPGCSIGELTRLLAGRCDRLRSVDVSRTAVARARRRCRDQQGVTLEVASVASDVTVGHDLVVFCEVGYYFTVDELDVVVGRLVEAMVSNADLVACHWLGHSADHRLHGATVHERIDANPSLHRREERLYDGFVLGTWSRD